MNEQEKYITQLETALLQSKKQTTDLAIASSGSMFASQQQSNLIEWQLELNDILERIEHLLRGDEVNSDVKGNVKWEKPKQEADYIFNNYGVQSLMRIISMYINRNTILSNYDDKTIKLKVYTLGCELTDLIFTSYGEMGIDTEKKKKLYPSIIISITDTVHSAYLRALKGEERGSLRTGRMVTQTDNLTPMMPQIYPKKRFNLLRPSTWRG